VGFERVTQGFEGRSHAKLFGEMLDHPIANVSLIVHALHIDADSIWQWKFLAFSIAKYCQSHMPVLLLPSQLPKSISLS